jgi:hypothetical protein
MKPWRKERTTPLWARRRKTGHWDAWGMERGGATLSAGGRTYGRAEDGGQIDFSMRAPRPVGSRGGSIPRGEP